MGARYQVNTPTPDFTGVIGGVAFAHGVAEVDEAEYSAALAYFNAQGYKVEKVAPVRAKKVEPDPRLAELEAEVDKLTAANTELAAKLADAETAAAAAKTKPQGGTR